MVETLRATVERTACDLEMPPWLVATWYAKEIEAGRVRVMRIPAELAVDHFRALAWEWLLEEPL